MFKRNIKCAFKRVQGVGWIRWVLELGCHKGFPNSNQAKTRDGEEEGEKNKDRKETNSKAKCTTSYSYRRKEGIARALPASTPSPLVCVVQGKAGVGTPFPEDGGTGQSQVQSRLRLGRMLRDGRAGPPPRPARIPKATVRPSGPRGNCAAAGRHLPQRAAAPRGRLRCGRVAPGHLPSR